MGRTCRRVPGTGHVSPAYVIKLLRILNAWGQFYAKKHGGFGIEEVKNPRGKLRQDIMRAYTSKKDYHGEASPLSKDDLKKIEGKGLLADKSFNWLFLSVWLGLRPEEIDNLVDQTKWRLEDESAETPVLWIYQTKLTSVDTQKAWKPIPLIHQNQKDALAIIKSQSFDRPLNKTLRKVFPGKRITCYSGRKGFTDLMLSLGQSLEDISIWMGHQSIETTWKHYKQKQKVNFKKIA